MTGDLRAALAAKLGELIGADCPDYWPDMDRWADALLPVIEAHDRGCAAAVARVRRLLSGTPHLDTPIDPMALADALLQP